MEDQKIIEEYKAGNTEKAFSALMDTYQSRLYAHVLRMVNNHADADDVLQNTFIKAWKGLASFRAESSLHTWLYRIATNESLTLLSKRKKQQTLSIDDQHVTIAGDGPSPSSSEIQAKLEQALNTLPTVQLAVFNLKYFQELKYSEIAKITGSSIGALKANYHHAVKKIELFLQQG